MPYDGRHSCSGCALYSVAQETATRLVTNYKNFFEIIIRNRSRTEESGERYGKGKEMLGKKEQKAEFLLLD